MTIRKLDRLIGEIAAAKDLLEEAERRAEDGFDRPLRMLAEWCRYGAATDIGNAQTLLWHLEADLKDAGRSGDTGWHPLHLPLRWLRQNLTDYVTHGRNFRSYVVNVASGAEPHAGEHHEAAAMLAGAEAGAAEYGYRPGNPENAGDPDYVAAMTALKALRMFVRAAREGEAILRDTATRLGGEMEELLWKQDRYRPSHGEVETMWHATAFAGEIAERGFQSERPDDRIGVGSFGQQHEISFTFDRAYAQTILRGLREFWMITHGRLVLRDILRWFAAEGYETDRLRAHLREAMAEPTPEDQAAKLFWYWLATTKSGAENPAFVSPRSLTRMLKDRAYADLGVVEARVRLEGDQSSYHHAEAEFRVQPSAVLSVRRVA